MIFDGWGDCCPWTKAEWAKKISELRLFRTIMASKSKNFDSFADMEKYILTRTKKDVYKHLKVFVAIILVMPFVTADCERSFSAMNNIKTEERNKLGEILNELMFLYDMTTKEKASLDQGSCRMGCWEMELRQSR